MLGLPAPLRGSSVRRSGAPARCGNQSGRSAATRNYLLTARGQRSPCASANQSAPHHLAVPGLFYTSSSLSFASVCSVMQDNFHQKSTFIRRHEKENTNAHTHAHKRKLNICTRPLAQKTHTYTSTHTLTQFWVCFYK